MTEKPKAQAPIRLDNQEVEEFIRSENKRVNEMIRTLPKSSLSFRIPAIHHMMLSAICTETGLGMSEVLERFVMAGAAKALEDKALPAVEDYPAVSFQISGQGKGAA